MEAEPKPAKTSSNLLDRFSAEDRKKAERNAAGRRKNDNSTITVEWLSIAEFGYFFGWEAIKDVYLSGDDLISHEQAMMLVEGARKVHAGHVIDAANATLAGNAPKHFDKILSPYRKEIDAVKK